ncbi:aldo/keto reductase [Prevotella sp. oral taxon 376]|uniref:aldo/keto reductase n=1 Tax=Prevotella sp. oral taxon 376 TaxID=712466 RepID=UPI001E38FFA2|nr:aldo/keto reductase [Prevotella sp. oral taxon 376]
MMDRGNQNLSRRQFLKRLGLTTASAAALASMGPISAFARSLINQSGRSALMEGNPGGMTLRVNRHTGDKVSLLGYGMMRLPQKDGKIDQDLVNKEVDYALAHGVNYFDTAPVYGKDLSEIATGIALHRHPRKSYFVATKMSDRGDHTLAGGKKMFHDSLEKLQIDYVDYYLLHSVGSGGLDKLNERFIDNGLLDWLCEQRDKGVIRNLGFSYHGDVSVFDWLLDHNEKYGFTFVQIEMNYIDWRHASLNKGGWKQDADAEYLYAKSEKAGVQNVVMEPLLGGRLAHIPEEYAKRLKAVRPEATPASWAFRWVGSHPNILTTLSGMTTMEVLEENVRTFSPLDPCTTSENELLAKIADDMSGLPVIPCTACQYCMPCPYGVNIPGNFTYYNKAINEGRFPDKKSPGHEVQLTDFVKGYKQTFKDSEWASQCMDCEVCLPKCPQQIRIPNQMSRIVELIGDAGK